MSVGVLVRVSEEERNEWKEAAARQGLSVNQLVRRTVAEALQHERNRA